MYCPYNESSGSRNFKYIKGDNAQEENDILMKLSSGDDNIVNIISKVKKTFYFI